MYTPPQQETDRFKAGRSAVLPQNRSFLFQMPNELPQNRRCLPDVYPPKRPGRKGLRAFYPSAPSTRRATPFECQKAAKLLLRGRFAAFSCPECWGYGIAETAHFSVFSARCTKRKGLPFREGRAETAGNGAATAKKWNRRAEISERRVTLYEKVTRSGAGAGHVHVPRHHQQRGFQGC